MKTLMTQKDNITLLSQHKNREIYSSQINYYQQGMPERDRLEAFICQVYKKYYNTVIDHFYPNLLSIESNNNAQTIKAIAGVRSAEHESLFSEYYLSESLEKTLFNVYKHPISRKSVVEVGNLAPASIGQMRWLITSITAFLYSAGFEYIVFTGVPGISNAFKRMNLPLEVLAEAKQSCLPEEVKNKWGDEYYKCKPMVFSGDIKEVYNIVKEMIYTPKENKVNKLIPLFEKSSQLGYQSRQNVPHSLNNDSNFKGKAS